MGSVIKIRGIKRDFPLGQEIVKVLKGIDLDIDKGEYVALMGPSGSGKSTLMNLLGCLDTPTAGTYELNGIDVSNLSDDELAEIRNKEIGFVFQTFKTFNKPVEKKLKTNKQTAETFKSYKKTQNR